MNFWKYLTTTLYIQYLFASKPRLSVCTLFDVCDRNHLSLSLPNHFGLREPEDSTF